MKNLHHLLYHVNISNHFWFHFNIIEPYLAPFYTKYHHLISNIFKKSVFFAIVLLSFRYKLRFFAVFHNFFQIFYQLAHALLYIMACK
jgi:hypothetical protein